MFPRRYTAGNLWRAAARCRLCPALWWTPPRRRINGCVLQRQTESERESETLSRACWLFVCWLWTSLVSKPINVCDQNCSFLMFWNIKEWTPGINQRVSGQCSRAFPQSLSGSAIWTHFMGCERVRRPQVLAVNNSTPYTFLWPPRSDCAILPSPCPRPWPPWWFRCEGRFWKPWRRCSSCRLNIWGRNKNTKTATTKHLTVVPCFAVKKQILL